NLCAESTTIIDVDELKPGDSVVRDFELQNNGTLDIERVTLETDYTVTDAKGDNTEDFGEHIEVEFLYNADKLDEVIYQTTLSELKTMTDRKSTRLNSSHVSISYAVFCLKKKKIIEHGNLHTACILSIRQ